MPTLTSEKRELLQRLLEKKGLGQQLETEIAPRAPGADAELSFAQERLWFLRQLEGPSATYNIPLALRLSGRLRVDALQAALSEIVRRHEILRTRFSSRQGNPVQLVSPPLRLLPLPRVDLSALPSQPSRAEAERLAKEEAGRPFSLSRGPLFRALLLVRDSDSILLAAMHHIVSDGWSLGVLADELAALYPAFAEKRPSPLPTLPIQYADFALWQRRRASSELWRQQLSYWKKQLEGAPDVLQLPFDRPRPITQTYRGGSQRFEIEQRLSQRLDVLGQECGATSYMTLLAAFSMFLFRYSGQADIVVGTPVAGRDRRETERLIGLFVNTLVMRIDLSGRPSFRDLLQQARRTAVEAYAHQEIPFEKLVSALQPQRDLSHNPVFQVQLVLQNIPLARFELPGLKISQLEVESSVAKLDLTLAVTAVGGKLEGLFEYNADLFEAPTIQRMAGHFERLLEGAAANLEWAVQDLPLMDERERRQLVVDWNQTRVDFGERRCLHELIESQAEASPDRMAVRFEGAELGYRELNRRANCLAHFLVRQGTQPDAVVAVAMLRSLELVISLLAIEKAGAAYLPIQPSQPAQRLAGMLADSGAKFLLTQDRYALQLEEGAARLINTERHWGEIAALPGRNPGIAVDDANLAYLIYTSGSTGQPKGAANTHAAIRNRILWMDRHYGMTPADRVLQKTPYDFDVSVWEFFWPLMRGACLAVARPEGHKDSRHLVEAIQREGITKIHFVPSMLQAFAGEEGVERCTSLQQVFCSGEALPRSLLEQFYQLLDARLHNLYGPTEAAIDVTFWECIAGNPQQSVPIGRPVANTQIYVLDRWLQPVPVRIAGELHIGGLQLARGYWRSPALTAQKFVCDPLSGAAGQRIYKSGDLVRHLPDGNIEFLGRLDHQVKIRGFRIELGEIEAALRSHPDVREAVVVALPSAAGSQRLVGYLVGRSQEEGEGENRRERGEGEKTSLRTPRSSSAPSAVTLSGLCRFLTSKLPDYMIPSLFVFLDKLPLNRNGKIDRKALPAPHDQIDACRRPSRQPESRQEGKLAEIWAEILGIERVGVDDDFFALGGDSIIALQMLARASQASIHLTLKQVFRLRTIARLAAAATSEVKVQRGWRPSVGAAPLTPVQHWFFESEPAAPHHFNQSLLLEAPPNLPLDLLPGVLKIWLRRHDAFRLRFVKREGGWDQTVRPFHGKLPFAVLDLSGLALGKQRPALESSAAALQASLSLEEGPLLRCGHFLMGDGEASRILLAVHHLAIDGVSWRILLSELYVAWRQRLEGKSVQLVLPSASFRSWSLRLQEEARSNRLRDEEPYWLNMARSALARPSLPLDWPIPEGANTVARSVGIKTSLDRQATRHLLADAHSAYRTRIDDLLLAALCLALRDWSGESRFAIDLERHGREDFEGIDATQTVGWFTAIFPVLLDLPSSRDAGEVIKSIKEQLRSVPGSGIGYGLLRYLGNDRGVSEKLGAMPPCEVVFNYLGQADQAFISAPGWRLAEESPGLVQSPRNPRRHLLEVSAIIVGGRLEVNWTCCAAAHRRQTIESLGEGFLTQLRSLIDHCLSAQSGGFTASDFPAARINQQELEKLIAGLE